ncbi:MAG: UDP-N-acetylmuramoyl-L-alanyl-D-glutamate--2,6-diaminopimelate ligase [Bacteroidales bacterium]|nr:UDP-N-acetylmuramoyl-L-alanyl-D-glutamate--2,6-diaminopimelate ligase [Bacteroidales bacterium]
MQLSKIIAGLDCERCNFSEKEITRVTFDSRSVDSGSLFVAQRGVHVDGHKYIEQAVEHGAVAVVCEEMPSKVSPEVTYVVVSDSSASLGTIASNYYGDPTKKIKLIGVTGTNGKTTTVTLLHRMFRLAGHHVGLISTIVNKIDEQEIATTHTTPDSLELNRLLSEMVKQGCDYCFMEVSSHAVVQQRIGGLTFYGGVFSNITHDHLDFHKTMKAYIEAKKGFFDMLPSDAFALVNKDDRNGMVMVQNTKAAVSTYSVRGNADFSCKIIENTFQGLHLEINGQEVWVRLVGRFNAYNLTAIYGVAVLCGMDKHDALRLLSTLSAAEGRFEYINGKGITAIVDYAHTPDALENVIDTINAIRNRQQRLITVVGCGGDRDKTKRPEMAQIAVRKSDIVILTSDNPRTENPEDILDDMFAGLSADEQRLALRISDRRQAIKTACMTAQKGDIILVAGKGHEKYQEINGVRSHFDDKEEVGNFLKD